MTDSQKQIIDNMTVDKLREHISVWTTQGHHHLVVYADEVLKKKTPTHDVLIPYGDCGFD